MRIFRSTLRKLVRRPATYIVGVILLVILALFYLAIGASAQMPDQEARAAILLSLQGDGAYQVLLAFVFGLGGLLAVAYAGAVGGAEWTWGTLRTAVARGESRSRYVLATFAGIAVVVGIGMLIAFGIGILFVLMASTLAGLEPRPPSGALVGELPELLGKSFFGLVEQAALGFAVAMIARSQLAGIGLGIALYFVEQFAQIFLPNVVQYMPFSVSGSLIISPEQAELAGATILEAPLAAALTATYLVAALLVASLFTERREIAG